MRFDFVIPVLQHLSDIEFYGRLALALENKGSRCGLIALTTDGVRRLQALGLTAFHLYDRFRDFRVSPAELLELEGRYRMNFSDQVFTEQGYYGESREALSRRLAYDLVYLERFCAEHEVGFFINNAGGELIRRAMVRSAAVGRTPNVLLDFSPFHGRMTLTTHEVVWDDLPVPHPPLGAAQRAFIEGLVAEVTAKRKMFARLASLGMDLGSLYRPFKNIARALLATEQQDGSLRFIYNERFRQLARRTINPRRYQQPVEGEPYVFFPLHVPGDSAMTVRAPQFHHQEILVDYLASRGLPSGTKLYVKPHPAGRDAYSVGMIARIARMPGVRLIDPAVNSHRMIAGARGIVVINSTVGFESLFHLKPVVVTGRVFYRGHGVTTDVEYTGDLPEAVRHALDHPPDREAVLRFLHACYLATIPVTWNDPSDDNLDRLSDAIRDKAKRIRAGRASAAAGGAPAIAEGAGVR